MTVTQVSTFEKTIQKTNAWLDEIGAAMSWHDRERAYKALRAVLHALRDRLPPNEAMQLGAQLPMLIRGFYYEGWHASDKPLKYRHKEEFLEQVRKEAPWLDGFELESAVSTVFGVLSSELGGGELDQVRRLLPAELRELWPIAGL